MKKLLILGLLIALVIGCNKSETDLIVGLDDNKNNELLESRRVIDSIIPFNKEIRVILVEPELKEPDREGMILIENRITDHNGIVVHLSATGLDCFGSPSNEELVIGPVTIPKGETHAYYQILSYGKPSYPGGAFQGSSMPLKIRIKDVYFIGGASDHTLLYNTIIMTLARNATISGINYKYGWEGDLKWIEAGKKPDPIPNPNPNPDPIIPEVPIQW